MEPGTGAAFRGNVRQKTAVRAARHPAPGVRSRNGDPLLRRARGARVLVDRRRARRRARRTPLRPTAGSGSSTPSTTSRRSRVHARSASRQPSCSCSTATTATAPGGRRGRSACRTSSSRECSRTLRSRWSPCGTRSAGCEIALWWEAERTLVVAEAIGTNGFFAPPGHAAGVHLLLRISPPRDALGGFAPEHLLVGHGEGLHGSCGGAPASATRSTMPARAFRASRSHPGARARRVPATADRRGALSGTSAVRAGVPAAVSGQPASAAGRSSLAGPAEPRVACRRVDRLRERRCAERAAHLLRERRPVRRRALPRNGGLPSGSAPPSPPAVAPGPTPSPPRGRSTRSSASHRGH